MTVRTLEVKSDKKVCSLLYPSIRKCMSTVEYLKSTPKFNKTFKKQAFRGQLLLAFCFIFFLSFLFNGFKPTEKLQEQNKELPHPFHPGSPLPLTILGCTSPDKNALLCCHCATLTVRTSMLVPRSHPVHRPWSSFITCPTTVLFSFLVQYPIQGCVLCLVGTSQSHKFPSVFSCPHVPANLKEYRWSVTTDLVSRQGTHDAVTLVPLRCSSWSPGQVSNCQPSSPPLYLISVLWRDAVKSSYPQTSIHQTHMHWKLLPVSTAAVMVAKRWLFLSCLRHMLLGILF